MTAQRFVIATTDGPDLELVGHLLASVDSRQQKEDHRTWTVLEVYRTASGRYVAVRERHHQGGTTTREARAFDSPELLQDWLGWSWLTKQLYEDAELAPRRRVLE